MFLCSFSRVKESFNCDVVTSLIIRQLKVHRVELFLYFTSRLYIHAQIEDKLNTVGFFFPRYEVHHFNN